ncbi:MAG: hypothetical protein NE327_10595 [Lentisphaeraceae bacterium]|nr:hypothetical protein [Lentisphaeraceae bacterium]
MKSGRPRSITLYQVKNKWFLKYYDHQGKRRNKGTGTEVEGAAKLLKKEIELLQINKDSPVSDKAKDLYFGEDKKPTELSKPVKVSILEDIAVYQQEIERLTNLVEYYRPFEQKYKDLLKLSHYRDLELSKDCPGFSEALEMFHEYYVVNEVKAGTVKKYTATTFYGKVKKLYEFVGTNDLYKITPGVIQEFIDYDFSQYPSRTRRSTTRSHLSRFYTWACLKNWGLTNPVTAIKKQKTSKKNKIKWFRSEDTLKVLKSLDDYYKPIFALMAFMGLNPNEISGIRSKDIVETKEGYEIYIVIWDEEDYEKSQKTGNRQSGLKVFKELNPYFDEFIKAKYPGKDIFFKAPGEKSAPRKKSKTPIEMWRPQQLSLEVNKLLPKGMLVQDLRRCAANYMLKEKKLTLEQVAGILRNTPQTVWNSYARYLPNEI